MPVVERRENIPTNRIESVAVIGAFGATGRLFSETLKRSTRVSGVVRPNQREVMPRRITGGIRISPDLDLTLSTNPDAVIVATPNPTTDTLLAIRKGIDRQNPPIVILPQNGVDVADRALELFEDTVPLVRASLFTTIDLADGNISYDKTHLRIGLAPLVEDGIVYSRKQEESVSRTRNMFERGGFDTRVYDDYESMQWTKLVANTFGGSAAITGLGPYETFTDPELYRAEMQALHIRLLAMSEEGIDFLPIPWSKTSLIPRIDSLPRIIKSLGPVRTKIAEGVAKGRDNKPPSATKRVEEGRPSELAFYHNPFIRLARKYDLQAELDEAILQVEETVGPRLATMTPDERKFELLDLMS